MSNVWRTPLPLIIVCVSATLRCNGLIFPKLRSFSAFRLFYVSLSISFSLVVVRLVIPCLIGSTVFSIWYNLIKPTNLTRLAYPRTRTRTRRCRTNTLVLRRTVEMTVLPRAICHFTKILPLLSATCDSATLRVNCENIVAARPVHNMDGKELPSPQPAPQPAWGVVLSTWRAEGMKTLAAELQRAVRWRSTRHGCEWPCRPCESEASSGMFPRRVLSPTFAAGAVVCVYGQLGTKSAWCCLQCYSTSRLPLVCADVCCKYLLWHTEKWP